ncbi:MAG: rubredoxin [Dehalococcoidia bacterium]|nr:rubredoxin [Dehalococcoidia bacterium]
MRKIKCSICGYVYDKPVGIQGKGVASGTKWEDIPDDFKCPRCTAPKSVFKPLEEAEVSPSAVTKIDNIPALSLKELSAGEVSVICSSLAKGCEKQRLLIASEAFNRLSDYFKSKTSVESGKTLDTVAKMLGNDIAEGFSIAKATAQNDMDKGALRSLVWSEKVSAMLETLLVRFAEEGDVMLENNNIYVCDICGFVFVDQTPVGICPVCKVPNFKILEMERK